MKRYAMAMIAALLASGCEGSTEIGGSADGSTDAPSDAILDWLSCVNLWDCNPGETCGTLVDCVEGQCRPDLDPVVVECPAPGDCVTDADCVIADPWDCCNGCPMVLLRDDLEDHECYYERGERPPGGIPMGCMMDCYACPPCYPQPIEARCEAGECVAAVEGCPFLGEEETREVTPAEIDADPHAYSGEYVVVSGSTIVRYPVCDTFCPGDTPCCDGSLYLDGVVRIHGMPCDVTLGCTATRECPADWDCGSFEEGGFYEVVGRVQIESGLVGSAVYVEGIREIEPSGFGGLYEISTISATATSPYPGVDCAPVTMGTEGPLVVADAGGDLVMRTPLFESFWPCSEYWGSREGSGFEVWVPIDCEDCGFWMEGEFVEEGAVEGTYHGWDGTCETTVTFEGVRP